MPNLKALSLRVENLVSDGEYSLSIEWKDGQTTFVKMSSTEDNIRLIAELHRNSISENGIVGAISYIKILRAINEVSS